MAAGGEDAEPKEVKAEGAKKAKGGKKGGGSDTIDDKALEELAKLMEARDFDKAVSKIEALLAKQPDDAVLLHNLGVVYTEMMRWQDAEDAFMRAFENQRAAKSVNFATMFGLATVLTEQGEMPKLLQAEALFRDCLVKAIAQEERGVLETYRAFTSLAENLELQKRWAEAVEAWKQVLELGSRMFGDEHVRVKAQRGALERAERLARWQKGFRICLWVVTALIPIVCVWLWNYVDGPGISEMMGFVPIKGGGEGTPVGDAAGRAPAHATPGRTDL